jgi:V/A-type H+-transporting ATPase subunit C
MAYKSYPFASVSLKAKSVKLVTKEKLMQIAEAKSLEDAYRSLSETGYGIGESSDDFERMIRRELRSAYEYTIKVAPDVNAFGLFLLRADYHNLKVFLKLALKKEPLESDALKENGTIPVEALRAAVTDKKYERLPEEMKRALKALDRQFSVKEDVSLIGLYLDTAYAEHVMRIVKGVRSDFIKRYMTAYADFTNVISFIRLRLLGFGKEMLKKVLIPNGRFRAKTFMEIFDTGLDSAAGVFARWNYDRPMRTAFEEFKKNGSLFAFEKARDDFLLNIIKAHRNDVFSIAPSIAYILAKEREADNIRLVMTAKANGKDADFVADRIKDMFS